MRVASRRAVVLMSGMLILNLASMLRMTGEMVSMSLRDPFSRPEFIHYYKAQKRVVGPMVLWFLDTQKPLQDTESLTNLMHAGLPADLTRQIMDFRPSLILMRVMDIPILQKDAQRSRLATVRPGTIYDEEFLVREKRGTH